MSFMVSAKHARQFLRHVLPAVIRPLRVLWNQVIGFVFLVLTLSAVPRGYRTVQEFKGDPESFFRLLLTGLFIVLMAVFAVYSFWRAHKVPKTQQHG